MSSLKRCQAGREGPRGRELKMGIIYVTIQIVPSNMNVESKTWTSGTRGTTGTRIKNRNNLCYNKNCSLKYEMSSRKRGQAGREGPRGRE